MITDIFGNKRYKLGLHIHTSISDGRVSPEESALIYKNARYDAVAFTDHWLFGEEREIDGLRIFSGCEYNIGNADTTKEVMHIVGLFMETDPCIPSNATKQQVIDAIKNVGGLAILAHPAWSLNTPEEIMSLSGFDALEIYNTVSGANQSFRPYSGIIVDILANKGFVLPLVATDDTHFYSGEDETKSYIMLKCDELTRENVKQAIKSGDFYATQGPELHTKVEDGKVIVDCSPCSAIRVITNSAYSKDRVLKGNNLTHYEYLVKEHEKWVRVEVEDLENKTAWSNVFVL